MKQCPCCDHFSLKRRGQYDICRVCFWEDSGQDLDRLDEHSGPNHLSLREARQNFLVIGACEPAMLKNVPPADQRAKYRWQPRLVASHAPPTLRTATLADAPALFDAHQDSVLNLCAAAYTPQQMQTWFEGRTAEIHRPFIEAGQILLAERQGRVLGFAGFVPGEMTLLFVRPEAAGTGLGSLLCREALARAAVGHDGPLTVVATRNAQGFYERHGFVAVGESFFTRGEAALRYEVVTMQRGNGSGP